MTAVEMMSKNPELMPALTLAYIGDAVYELEVRKYLLRCGLCRVDDLHKKAISLVRANTQADLVPILSPALSEQEASILRRGRNAKGQHNQTGATVPTYKIATGLQTVRGNW